MMMGGHGGKPKKAKKAKSPGGGGGVVLGFLGLVALGLAIFYLVEHFGWMK